MSCILNCLLSESQKRQVLLLPRHSYHTRQTRHTPCMFVDIYLLRVVPKLNSTRDREISPQPLNSLPPQFDNSPCQYFASRLPELYSLQVHPPRQPRHRSRRLVENSLWQLGMGRDKDNTTYQTFRNRTAQVPLLSTVVLELLQLPFRGKLCYEDGAVQVGRRLKRWGKSQTLAFRVLPPVLLFPRSPLAAAHHAFAHPCLAGSAGSLSGLCNTHCDVELTPQG
jgi:hypothetical protein